MTVPAVLVAVRETLLGVSGLPTIIWPNEAAKVDPPYLTFDNGPLFSTPVTIDGEERFEFRPLVSIRIAGNTFTAAADVYIAAIQSAFKIGTIIEDGGSEIGRCDRTPLPDGGRPEDGLWRIDMTLRVSSHQRL